MSVAKLPAGYPLTWPDGWDRTSWRSSGNYKVTFARARTDVLHSLKLMGVGPTRIAISANIPLRLDGLPLASAREPADPGVSVWWNDAYNPATVRVIACDAWNTTRDNLRAIGLSLEGLRAIERSKSTQIIDRAMQSFSARALPAPLPWFCGPLGLDHWPTTELVIRTAYTGRAKEIHPDHGGSHEAFVELGRAKDAALKELGR